MHAFLCVESAKFRVIIYLKMLKELKTDLFEWDKAKHPHVVFISYKYWTSRALKEHQPNSRLLVVGGAE
jgi:hypothetical protein